MTGGGGVMTTSASTGVVYSAPQAPYLDLRGYGGERGTKGGERRRKEVKGEEVGGKGKGMEEKGEEMEGEVKGEMIPHFLVQRDANVSQ